MNSTESSSIVSLFKTKARLSWVDYAKGIGIFLVVVGHILRGLINSSILEPSGLLSFVDNWIYAFHMPLFFFISGLFIQRSLNKPFGDFFIGKLCTIAYPYFLWSLIQGIFQAIGSRYANNNFSILNIWKIIYEPLLQFWFLYTLFAIVIIYAIFYHLKLKPFFFFIFAVILYICQVFNIDFGSWGILYLFRNHAIYFALGAVISVIDLTSFLMKIRPLISIYFSLFGYTIVGWVAYFQVTQNIVAIPLIAVIGICASVLLASVLDKLNVLKFLHTWGKLSLGIFVAHTLAASVFRIILQHFFNFVEPITHLVLGTIIGIYIPILIDLTCSKLSFESVFTLKLVNGKTN
ncbi:acyltransferase [Nostoc sp. CENA543]|uniref:acyltransferase family protein n=1 Tax=Nostoc sp. CENA543 TaxID=1869241 RepID=UPI000CA0F6F2|nr:acyltransferase family protein [Nostoc sp. CENA543]AUT04401.1 acyltransferase [Nostoc sp. CENA543]